MHLLYIKVKKQILGQSKQSYPLKWVFFNVTKIKRNTWEERQEKTLENLRDLGSLAF